MVSAKTILAYLLYALLAAILFLVLLFPDQAVKAYVDSRLAAIDPSLSMEAETIRPAMPPGLKMTGVDLNRNNVRLAHFEDARMSPDLATVLQDKKQVRFQARIAGGTVNGRATLEDTGPAGPLRVEAVLSDIRLGKLDAIKTHVPFALSGSLNGRMTHDGTRAPTGMTNGLLNVSDLHITLREPFFGISELVMDQTDADFSVSSGNLRLKSLTFDGPMVEGKITGTIELRQPVEQSRLNLTGNAKPRPELLARLQETLPQGIVNTRTLGTRGLTFRVRGSIDDPDLSMR
ncbi:type II secretion system protein GspN [uncultured Desulfosarcina sp.]|uniref:type II secretion system protein GspN n=1 Tax=uncultured Desulfosarcina sp. TaxID=218289 RepID=UPI0029C707DC|nr:type II secretion system protein GspN [uncultured Desulfosarcina sp.]